MNVEQLEKITALIEHGGPALLAALLLANYWLQRKDLAESRKRVVELENRVFEQSQEFRKTVRKLDHTLGRFQEMLTRVLDRL